MKNQNELLGQPRSFKGRIENTSETEENFIWGRQEGWVGRSKDLNPIESTDARSCFSMSSRTTRNLAVKKNYFVKSWQI